MTPERKNEIWAMLTQEEREDFQGMYELRNSKFDIGYNAALNEIFGEHNLTAQAGEKPTQNSFSEAQTASNNAFPLQNRQIDYAQYRLVLAKEIAVAMIKNDWSSTKNISTITLDAVDLANEIVKRLKETEE